MQIGNHPVEEHVGIVNGDAEEEEISDLAEKHFSASPFPRMIEQVVAISVRADQQIAL